MRVTFNRLNQLAVLIVFLIFGSCGPQLQDDIPYVLVEIDVNLNNTEYVDLLNDGGYVYILGGVRGIIIYRVNENEYRAFERNSPFNASAACSIIDVDSSGLFMVDPCHNILYDFTGMPISGNSLPLRQYDVILERNWLYIRSGGF